MTYVMFVTVHATVGAIIGEQTNNVWLAFALSFLSHFIFDAIPHGDQNLLDSQPTKKTKAFKLIKLAAIDLLVMSLALLTYLQFEILRHPLPALVGALGAILPDFISGFAFLRPKGLLLHIQRANEGMHYIFNGFTISILPGVIVQLITLIALLFILVRF